MISGQDLDRLIRREDTGCPVLSLFLDMSVTSENKRTYRVFLNQQRAGFPELDSDRSSHHREAVGEAFERVERWIDERYDEANKGVALYTEVGGPWLEGLQVPVPLANRMALAERPVIGPLAQLVRTHSHYGVFLLDREHLRMLSIYLDRPVREHQVRTHPYPAPHDVQRGGYSQSVYQRRKAEETRHFFREFAQEVGEFQRRYAPDSLVLLGTEENVKNFLDFLPAAVRSRVVHTGHPPEAGLEAPVADVIERLAPVFRERVEAEQAEAVRRLRERVGQHHLAVAGFADTLEQLQEGKVATLVIGRDIERSGGCCLSCGFYLEMADGRCPYCAGEVRDGVDLVENMIRIAYDKDAAIVFVSAQALADFSGVGALLRF